MNHMSGLQQVQPASISTNDNNPKRQVIQRLYDMGFTDNAIRSAITECGYYVELCADWIVNRKQNITKSRLFVGMEVWVFSPEDNDWVPGHIVCIPSTKTIQDSVQTCYMGFVSSEDNTVVSRLLAIMFNHHDFRWLETDSVEYKIQNEKPAPLMKHNTYDHVEEKEDETDYNVYYVTFTHSTLGMELYSDEEGFNCIVGRCMSGVAREKVTPGSQIVQVNDRWLANYRFEVIQEAVEHAAAQPPISITFIIKKQLLRQKNLPQPTNEVNLFQNDKTKSNENNTFIDTLSFEQCDMNYKTGSKIWQCEFCTFRNMENTTRICEMCQRKNKQTGAIEDNDDVETSEIEHVNNDVVEQEIVDILGYDIENKRDNDVINSNLNGPSKQFENFLRKHRLQKYYKKFEENECCDIRDIEYLIDQEDFIKNNIGIKHPIDRKRFLGEANKLKKEMDVFQNEYQSVVPSVLIDILKNYGIVTMSILCTEVRNKFDLKNKFNINNHNQINLLWNLIQKQLNPIQNPIKNNKQINEEEGLQCNNKEMLDETVYI